MLPDLGIPKAVYDVANVCIFALIILGVVLHRRRTLHVRMMLTCFGLDVLMVLLIELQRAAVEQAVTTHSNLLRFHIAVSVAAMVLWILQLIVGRRILRGENLIRRHRLQAWLFLLFRATNVVTAFFVGPGLTS